MKKLLYLSLAAILILCSCYQVVAAEKLRVGFLTKLNITLEEFQKAVLSERKQTGWNLLSKGHENGEIFYFYDSLVELIMALNANKIDEAVLPKFAGEYVINYAHNLTIASVARVRTRALAFGFNKTQKGRALQKEFNEALNKIKGEGKLLELQNKYLSESGIKNPEPIQFQHFDDDNDTIRVAVTGDLPPIDYVVEEGFPAGFSTAVIAEIGRELHKNIELFDTDVGARTASLTSGRADAVFWYQLVQDSDVQADVPENILLSEPYYEWNIFLYIRKK